MFPNIPFSTAWPYELCRETEISCETLEDFWSSVTFFKKDLLDEIGGRREWELRLCWGCCSSGSVGKSGLAKDGNISGVCLLVSDEERNEPLNRDNAGVPRKLRLGDGTLLYKSIDCLKHYLEDITY